MPAAATGGAGAAAVAPVGGGSTQTGTVDTGATNFGNPSSPNYSAQLAGALFQQNGMVTSEGNDIGSTYAQSIAGLQSANQQANAGLAAGLATNTISAQRTGAGAGVAEETARRGMGMNTALISNIQETTNDNLNQLNSTYQQAVSNGDSATASKVADLQVAALTAKLNQQQQVFTNMTTIASTLNSAQQTQIQQEAQNFQEQNAVAQIGVQFGIPMTPGMTLAQMVSKATPLASQKEQATIASLMASTYASQEQAALAAAGINQLVTPTNSGAMASQYFQSLLEGDTQGATKLGTSIQSQGPGSQTMFNQAIQQQVNTVYNGYATGADGHYSKDANGNLIPGNAPNASYMQNSVFLPAFEQQLSSYTPGTPQWTQAANNLKSQLSNQYTSTDKNSGVYGVLATPQQITAASTALTNAWNQYVNSVQQGSYTYAGSLGSVWASITGGAPVPEQINTPVGKAIGAFGPGGNPADL